MIIVGMVVAIIVLENSRNNRVTIDRNSSSDNNVMITSLCLGANKTVTRFQRPEKRRM